MKQYRALKPIVSLLPMSIAGLMISGCSVIPPTHGDVRAESGAPAVIITPRPDTDPPPRRTSTLQREMVSAHNEIRIKWGMKPLVWNAQLAADAQEYADSLARTGTFKHADQSQWSIRQSENLWKGTKGAFTYEEMVWGWIGESQYYKHGIFPDNSTTGKWNDVGHFTTMIWATTTEMGCALSSNFGDDYLVCRYSPVGNIVGRDPLVG